MENSFSFAGLFSSLGVIREYIDPFPVILWAILGGIAGLVLIVVLLIVFRRKVFVRRRYFLLKLLPYCYALFLPLFGGFMFMQWFGLHKCQTQLTGNVPVYLGKTNEIFDKYLKEEVRKVVAEKYFDMTGREMLGKPLAVAGEALSGYMRSEEAGVGDKIAAWLVKTDYFREHVVDAISEKMAEALKTEKRLTDALLDVKMRDMLDKGALGAMIEGYIRQMFGSLKAQVLLVFLLVMVIPLAEIVVANLLVRKQAAGLPTPEQ